MIRPLILPTLTLTLLLLAAPLAAGDEPLRRFQEAVALEHDQGKPTEALAQYRALLETKDLPAGLRARAGLRVAACLERLGRAEEARAAYRALLAQADAWREVKKPAELALERLKPVAKPTSGLPQGWLGSWCARSERMDFSVKDVDVRALLLEIAKLANLDLVLSPSLHGAVTTDLKGIAPRRAIEAIVRTTGDFSVVEVEGVLRAVPKSALEVQLVTRAYRLVPHGLWLDPGGGSSPAPKPHVPAKVAAAADPAELLRHLEPLLVQRERRQRLIGVLQELVAGSGVAGEAVGYDAATQTVFARCSLPSHEAIARVLKSELRAEAPAPVEEPIVSLSVEGASSRFAALALARTADRPLVLSAAFTGEVSAFLHNVPYSVALRALVESVGDYVVLEGPAGHTVLPRSADELHRAHLRWPLRGDARAFWRAAHGSLRANGREGWPIHPLLMAIAELAAASGQAGAMVRFDPGSHALIAGLSPALGQDLERALVHVGLLSPPERPALGAGEEKRGTNARSLIQEIAASEGVNVIMAPNVSGRVDLILPKRSPGPRALLEAVAHAAGDFVVVELEADLYRIAPRSLLETRLESKVIPLDPTHPAPAELWASIQELAAAGGVAGSSVLRSQDRSGRWSLVVTLPSFTQHAVERLVADSRPTPALLKALAYLELQVGRGERPVERPERGLRRYATNAQGTLISWFTHAPTLAGRGPTSSKGWTLLLSSLRVGEGPVLVSWETDPEPGTTRDVRILRLD